MLIGEKVCGCPGYKNFQKMVKGLETEVGANRTLSGSPTAPAYNTGVEMALEFISSFKQFDTLFQTVNFGEQCPFCNKPWIEKEES